MMKEKEKEKDREKKRKDVGKSKKTNAGGVATHEVIGPLSARQSALPPGAASSSNPRMFWSISGPHMRSAALAEQMEHSDEIAKMMEMIAKKEEELERIQSDLASMKTKLKLKRRAHLEVVSSLFLLFQFPISYFVRQLFHRLRLYVTRLFRCVVRVFSRYWNIHHTPLHSKRRHSLLQSGVTSTIPLCTPMARVWTALFALLSAPLSILHPSCPPASSPSSPSSSRTKHPLLLSPPSPLLLSRPPPHIPTPRGSPPPSKLC
jgi:hypothetical protein